jgi:hypothetical protein
LPPSDAVAVLSIARPGRRAGTVPGQDRFRVAPAKWQSNVDQQASEIQGVLRAGYLRAPPAVAVLEG